jgi:hypothetical protein
VAYHSLETPEQRRLNCLKSPQESYARISSLPEIESPQMAISDKLSGCPVFPS